MRDKTKRGQGMVEFALTLPVILVLFLGIAILFHLFAVIVTMHNAASEGGRRAQVWSVSDGVPCVDAVEEAITRTTPFDIATIQINDAEGKCASNTPFGYGELIEIALTVNWEPLFVSTLLTDVWS
ncbi:MAG: pilus assembly protein, partial [Anaerolineales bacterium]